MNLKERLRHIAEMSLKDRQMGRTTMIVKAAQETGGMVLAHNHVHAKQIEREHKVPARSIDINLTGFNGPFFLDHHAVENLLMRAAGKIEETEKENEKLIAMTEGLTNELARLQRQLEASMAVGMEMMKKVKAMQQGKTNG